MSNSAPQDPSALHRCEALRRRLREDGIPALLVVKPANVTYLSSFSGEATYLLIDQEAAVLISDARYEEQLQWESPEFEAIVRRSTGEPMARAVAEAVRRRQLQEVAFEAHGLTVAQLSELREALPAVEWRPTRGLVEALRARKSQAEVEKIRRAVQVAEEALMGTLQSIHLRSRPTETDVAGRLNWELYRRGATQEAFVPIVASRPRCSQPHASLDPTARVSPEGVLIDWGARVAHYVSDLTRWVGSTRIAEPWGKLLRVALEAQQAALQRLRPGVRAEEVDAEARAVVERAGFGPFFKHASGHGIGLEVHEEPFLRPGSQTILEPGMVVTVEPGIYLPGEGGIRLEDDVWITEDGPVVLSTLPPWLEVP
jgi:Xaa-Pro aminopeptidase